MKKHKPPPPFTSSDPTSNGFCTTILRMTGSIEPSRKPVDPQIQKNKGTRNRNRKKDPATATAKVPEELLPADVQKNKIELPGLPAQHDTSIPLLRLFVKKGEYIYARPTDIVLIESCDHLVKVYIAYGDKIKRAVRNGTLKDFLSQLPSGEFLRLGRFCAINTNRLSGGNYQEQVFEFDFRVSIKLKHTLPFAAFKSIGI